MAQAKKTVWSVFWSAIEAGGVSGLQFVTLIVMARLIGPADFGLAALSYSVIMLIGILITGLFNDAIVQRRDLEKRHLDSAFWTVFLFSILVVAGCWAGAPRLAALFDEPAVAPVFAWMSLSLLAQGSSCVHVAKFRRDLNFKAVAVRHLCGNLTGMTVGITLAFNGFGVWSLVAQRLAAASISTLLVWVNSSYRPGLGYSWHRLWDLLRFGLPIVAGQFVHTGHQRLFNLIIGWFFGTTVLGFVDIAFRLVFNLRTIISGALYNVSLPLLSRRQNDMALLRRSVSRAVEFTALITQPLFAGLAVSAQEVVTLVLGAQWSPAIPLVQILCVLVMLQSARQVYGTAITALGKPHINLIAMCVGLFISILSVLIFGREDFVIATMAWCTNVVVMWPIMFVVTSHVVGISAKDQAAAFIGPMVSAAAMAMGLFGIKTGFLTEFDAATTLSIIIPLGVGLYAGVLMLLRPKLIPSFGHFILGALSKGKAAPAD